MTKQLMSQFIFLGLLAATLPAMAASVGEFVPDSASSRDPKLDSIHVLNAPGNTVGGPRKPGAAPPLPGEPVEAWVPRTPAERIVERPGLQEAQLKRREGPTRTGANATDSPTVGGRFEPGPPVTSQPRPKPKPAVSSQ